LRAGVITPHDWLLSLAAVRVASSPSAYSSLLSIHAQAVILLSRYIRL